MESTSQRVAYFPALTGLRGVAAISVAAYPFWQFEGAPTLWLGGSAAGYPLHALAACGFLGVDLFFVLSGFLLSLPFLAAARGRRRTPRLDTYFVRRARRVIPALWFQIAALALVARLALGAWPFDLRTAALHGLFLQHLVHDPGTINPVYWTLPIEWWFYFTLPLAAYAFRWVRWWLLLCVVLVCVIAFRLQCAQWLAEGRLASYAQIILLRGRFDEFFLGILAAWFHLATPRDCRWRGVSAMALIGLLGLLPSLAARGDLFVRADFPWLFVHFTVVGTLLAAVIYAAAGSVAWLERCLANRVALWFGAISYSLYLWHYPILQLVARWHGFLPGIRLAGTVTAIVATALVSWASYRFVEAPFLSEGAARRVNGRGRKRSASQDAPAPKAR